MFSTSRVPTYFQFAHYFHFAEPFPPGAEIAYADSVLPIDQMETAAESLRDAEVEAVRTVCQPIDIAPSTVPESRKLTLAELDAMSIDEIRAVANIYDVPDRSKITEKAELIDEILRRM